MDSMYVVHWTEKTPQGVFTEKMSCYDDLTSATRDFMKLCRNDITLNARIMWGDTIIEEYRRDFI